MTRAPLAEALALTGMKRRTLQSLAKRGKVPGAAKLGGMWYFDLDRLRRWIAAQEMETCQPTSTAAMAPGMPAFRPEALTYVAAYKRATSGKRNAA